MNNQSTVSISCLGSGSGKPGEPAYDEMFEVGRMIAKFGYNVSTGGYGGSGMEAPAAGFREVSSEWAFGYFVSAFGIEPNEYVAPIDCCELKARWFAEQAYGLRLGTLLLANGFVIGPGAGVGTLTEVAAIINLNLKFWKDKRRCAILEVRGVAATEFDKMIMSLLATLPDDLDEYFQVFDSGEAAARWVCGK